MQENRVTIADIVEALGLSTATVSNVIHGKTKKISDETVKRVQHKLEEMNYIPNMAGILLAQNMLTTPIQGLFVGALSGLSAAAGVIIGKHLGKKDFEDAYQDSDTYFSVSSTSFFN